MEPELYTNIDSPFLFLGKGFSPDGLPVLVQPKEIFTTNRRAETRKILREIQDKLSKGFSAAGWISYEAGDLFLDSSAADDENGEDPILWFGIFEDYRTLSSEDLENWERSFSGKGFSGRLDIPGNKKDYLDSFQKIQEHLRRGDVYQVNLTFPIFVKQAGSLGKFFFEVRKNQPVPYEAWIHTGTSVRGRPMDILSFSPELFWERKGDRIRTVPMKGTRPRGKNETDDLRIEEELISSEKDKSENLMITDLLRNDLGRISRSGSVEVPKLFSIEKYPTVFQMTSEIRSELVPKTDWLHILDALFPGGSITGAPKKRSFELIRELEEKRGVYTGGIFFLTPEKETASIAIRTLELREISKDMRTGKFGVGSGITVGSNAEGEWEESLSKVLFLKQKLEGDSENFYLFTTMLWRRGKFYDLGLHSDRMQDSANRLGFPWSKDGWNTALREVVTKLPIDSGPSFRIRISLNKDGSWKTEWSPLGFFSKTGTVLLSKHAVDSGNAFLFHKTSVREFYSIAFDHAISKGYMDMIFLNENGFLTEGCIHSVFLRKKGEWHTPELSLGLLPGIARKKWMKRLKAKESRLVKEDLLAAEKVILVNSVRGFRSVGRVDME